MYRCKHARKDAVHKHTKSKIMISLLAMALVCCVSISGTLAWVISQTDPVVNTFTYGDINITLDETGATPNPDGDPGSTNEYTMIPGIAITKDPTVTVKAQSEDCWLFVKLEESENFDEYLRYSTEKSWTLLKQKSTTGSACVYYQTVAHNDADQKFTVIKDNTVFVRDTVTKEMLNALDETAAYPTLTVTAYAVQRDGIINDSITNPDEQAQAAWKLILSEQ